jgi:hypothetical protein
MPKTKKSVKVVAKKKVSAPVKSSKVVKSVHVKAPQMSKTLFGASYLLILAVLSLLLITVSNQLLK